MVLENVKNVYLNIFKINLVGEFIRFKYIKNLFDKMEKEPEEILDAGCGGGLYSSYLSKRYPNSKITACDINNNIKRVDDNVTFLIKDLLSLEYERKFDLIICVDVIEHIANDEKVIENFSTSLRDRGSLVLHVPKYPLEYKYFIKYYHQDDHIRDGYQSDQIKTILKKYNLEVVSYKPTFNAIETFIWEIGYILRKNKFSKMAYFALFPILSVILKFDFRENKKGNGILIHAKKIVQ